MSNTPKVSVVVATHNNEKHLGECLDSILCGYMDDIELIIVDVLSTDGTKEIISETADGDNRIVFLADSYGSIGRAKNIAIDHARAPYIVFVEPEDVIDGRMLEYFYREMEDSRHIDLMLCETDSFGNDTFGRTNREKKERFCEANKADSRTLQRDSRLYRWQLFESCGCYRMSFLTGCGIRHYETPGIGTQDIAFKFLAAMHARVFATEVPLYNRRMDMVDEPVSDVKAVYDVCNEYRFLKGKLMETANDWWRMRFVFWQAYFTSNMELYEKLSDELKPVLSKRMQADLKQAIGKKELSRDNLDIQVKEDMELLLRSVQEFDAKQREVERERHKISENKLEYEARVHHMLVEQERRANGEIAGSDTLGGQVKRVSGEQYTERNKRLSKRWLTDEMSKDLAPLRLLIGLSPEEMGDILGVSGSAYKSMEAGKKQVSWDQYLALLFIFRYNERTAAVTDILGLYPEALEQRMRKGIIGNAYV